MAGLMVSNPRLSSSNSVDDASFSPELSQLPDQAAEELSGFFKLLSDPMRLRILHYLMQKRELNVGALCDLLEKTQPAVSHHLALLRGNHIIQLRREGKHNFYRISADRLKTVTELLFSVSPQEHNDDIQFDGFQLKFETEA